MQTFLPVQPRPLSKNAADGMDYRDSARVLDSQRLGKQRVEALQIVTALTKRGGWKSHPAVRMWSGHVPALIQYGLDVCDTWVERGNADSVAGKLLHELELHGATDFTPPYWMGDEAFHRSHRSNLIRKKPEHYRPFWPGVPDDLPYVWFVPAGLRTDSLF